MFSYQDSNSIVLVVHMEKYLFFISFFLNFWVKSLSIINQILIYLILVKVHFLLIICPLLYGGVARFLYLLCGVLFLLRFYVQLVMVSVISIFHNLKMLLQEPPPMLTQQAHKFYLHFVHRYLNPFIYLDF